MDQGLDVFMLTPIWRYSQEVSSFVGPGAGIEATEFPHLPQNLAPFDEGERIADAPIEELKVKN